MTSSDQWPSLNGAGSRMSRHASGSSPEKTVEGIHPPLSPLHHNRPPLQIRMGVSPETSARYQNSLLYYNRNTATGSLSSIRFESLLFVITKRSYADTMASENLAPHIISRLMNEIRDLVRRPADGIEYVNDDDEESVTEIHAILSGPGMSYAVWICLDPLSTPSDRYSTLQRAHPTSAENFDSN